MVSTETVLVHAISLAAIGLLLSTVSRHARWTGDGFVVQYGAPYKILAIVMVLMTLTVGVSYFFVGPNRKEAALFLIVLFGVIAIPLTMLVFFTRVEADREGLIVHSPWRRARRIAFADIESVSLVRSGQHYEIRTRAGEKVLVHIHLSGVPDLLKLLEVAAPVS